MDSTWPSYALKTSSSEQNSNPEDCAPAKNGLYGTVCVRCRHRRVKCDKLSPCSGCAKSGSDCVFRSSRRVSRHSKSSAGDKSEDNRSLLSRVKTPSINQMSLAGYTESSFKRLTRKPIIDAGVGALVVDGGNSYYISNKYWISIYHQVGDIHEDSHETFWKGSMPTPSYEPTVLIDQDSATFTTGQTNLAINLRSLHPSPSDIPFLWQVFIERVDPLIKILHVPTVAKLFAEGKFNLGPMSSSTEALMFAVYFAAIMSLDEGEIQQYLFAEKSILQKGYRVAAEQALIRASYISTSEIVTLQALVLFLNCAKCHDNTRFLWSLTGAAIRVAQSLGLHRDGTILGLDPFTTEIRRRLWWQIYVFDILISEDCCIGQSIEEDSFDTQMPLNFNDSDLRPDATIWPTPQTGISDMTFCLFRLESFSIAHYLSHLTIDVHRRHCISQASQAEKEEFMNGFRLYLESRYSLSIREGGFASFIRGCSRALLRRTDAYVNMPSDPTAMDEIPEKIRDRLLITSISNIEFFLLLKTKSSPRRWAWLTCTFVPWRHLAHILSELTKRLPNQLTDRAWKVVEESFDHWGGTEFQNRNEILWLPMRKLLAKAKRKREGSTQAGQISKRSTNLNTPTSNQFINKQLTESGSQTDLTYYNIPLEAYHPTSLVVESDSRNHAGSTYQLQQYQAQGVLVLDNSVPSNHDLGIGMIDDNNAWEGWDFSSRNGQSGSRMSGIH